jgi:triosephosphate isomerase
MTKVRIPVVAANFKENKSADDTARYLSVLVENLKDPGADVVVCPPVIWLSLASALCAGSVIQIGAQNAHWEQKGAFTGEVSPTMVREAGAKYVIIGHSERRKYFGEASDGIVNKKLLAALEVNLIPIICVGETPEQRELGKTDDMLYALTKVALNGIPKEQLSKIIFAYEPVWAIGTGINATPEDASNAIKQIRKTIDQIYGNSNLSQNVRILYGGSVNPANAGELLAEPDIDGLLVGGASLDVEQFIQIVRACA